MSSFKYNPFTNNLDEVGTGNGNLVVSTINNIEPDENGNFSITGSGLVEITETENGIDIDVSASSLPTSTNTYWFSNDGSDANDGKSISTPFLNIATAITAAASQSPMWTVQCADSSSVGAFLTPVALSIPAGITVYAPNSDFNANITLTGTGTINLTCRNILASSGDLITLSNQTFNLTGKILLGSATIKCLNMTAGGVVTLNVQSMQSVSGTVINLGSGGQVSGFAGLIFGTIANNSGTVNLVCAQATVTKSGNNPQNVNVITSNSFSQIASMVLDPSGTISTSQLATNSFSLGAWDVDGAAYSAFINFIAGNTPSMSITNPSGASATMDGVVVGSTTPANAQFLTPINNQTGTTYTLSATDEAKMVTLSNASAVTLTLPQQSTLTTSVGYWAWLENKGAGTATIVKEGSETLKGNTSLATNAVAWVYRDTTTSWQVFGGTATVNMPGWNTLIQTVSNVTYTLVGYAGNAGTILGVYQKCRAFTTAGTFNIQINGVNVTSLTSVVPSTAGSYTAATGANTFARGDQITIVFSGTNAVLDQNISIDFTQQF